MIVNIAITKANLDEYQIFDVRTPLEWEEGVLKNAELVYLYDNKGFINPNFTQEIKEKLNNKPLAFVCRSGNRSQIAAQIIQDELKLSSTNLEGGMMAYYKEK
ncbi:rhodanese-like domain-containing protein [Campylobacter sp. TTU-622]|uniref:rhodanese-like domain-containing protein n=1 Tax=unclassified Campylobacter TaxID=2593542 RepID=UPI001908B54F|nr:MULTISPECIES: rhodanese-like domain-containing protein [unclassified Campylobacter]MBK1971597.1 rhodanese-like domain-containing protein [Campylobacter sp. TTU_617]MBK1972836.1 rhodanese-like domain-containing protein [Campylobacter sp. TTU-622]